MGFVKQQVIACRVAIFATISLLLIMQYGLASHYDETDLIDIDCSYCLAQVHIDGTDIAPNADLEEAAAWRGGEIAFPLNWHVLPAQHAYFSRGPPAVF